MEPEVFERFREIIYKKCGISLSDEKHTLVTSRIQKRLRALKLSDEIDYLEIIETDASGAELEQLIDAVSTNTTYFWREAEHFLTFANILKQWKQEKRPSIKIWCAAASSGQEPYTLAMLAHDHFCSVGTSAKVLATDISTRVLTFAHQGIYSDDEVSKLPPDMKHRHFLKAGFDPQRECETWQVQAHLTSKVVYKKLNLISFPYPLHGPLDAIFCRNVMIYFDLVTRRKVIAECERLLRPGGFLFLSLSESLLGIDHSLEKHSTSVFRKGT